jgi:hypothetical protein
VQGSGSRPESARGVCSGSSENHRVTWLSHKTKTGGSAGGDGIRARREASLGLDFSSVCKESELRVNGSFHGCVDSRFVARWIFVSFSSCFRRFFMRGLFLRFCGVWARICWWESWIVDSCIFVLDLDPPNSEFVPRLNDFGWNLGFWLSSVAIRFPTF